MSNFGFRHLRVVNSFEPSFREARSAVGASSVLKAADVFDSVAEAIADCTLVVGTTAVRTRELQHPVRRLEVGARLIRKRMASSGVAVLFGSEKFGLSNEDLSHCHWLMRIPTCEQNISMNLGQAVAVCLYELIRDSKTAGEPAKLPPANAEEVERITTTADRSAARQRIPDAPQSRRFRGKNSSLGAADEFAAARRRDLAGHPAPNFVEDGSWSEFDRP